MPLLTRLWAWFKPLIAASAGRKQVGFAAIALLVLVLAAIPAIGYEVVRLVDRKKQLSTPATWVAGSLVAALVVVTIAPSTLPAANVTPAGPQAAVAQSTAAAQPTSAALAPAPRTVAPISAPATTAPDPTPEITEPPLGSAPVTKVEKARVVRVVDGDTIVIDRGNGNEKLRYIGMDTPETVDPDSPVEWMGPQASAANAKLLDGKTVYLERDVSETDRYGRLLRYVWLKDSTSDSGWLLVNLALVQRGFAQVSTYPPDVRYVELYLAAQDEAQGAGLGLWGPQPTPNPTPKPTPKPTKKPLTGSNCHPSYIGECLKVGIGDYDCAGGSGNGPNYVYGTVEVVGPDEFGLDADHDGYGCE